MSLIVSISGVRGIVGKDLNPETVIQYTRAFAAFCLKHQKNKEKIKIFIGRDGRNTGKILTNIVSSTLLSLGCDVVALGVCPTPTVSLAVEKSDTNGGISVTASHNPMEWNGLKFFNRDGMFLDHVETNELKELVKVQDLPFVDWDKLGLHESDSSWIDKHIEMTLQFKYIDVLNIRKKKFKIVLDCINAAGGVIMPKLLDALGCEVIPINCDIGGIFSRTPEPIPENLTELCNIVKQTNANLGIAVDPDVDRLVLITENGEPYGEEYTIASAVEFILRKQFEETYKKEKVVVNLSTTRAVDDIAKKYNADVYRTPVGEINVAKKMKELGAIIGGEGSGGVILPALHYSRDAIVGTALILQMLSEFNGTLSELKNTLPKYYMTKSKIEIGALNADEIIQKIIKKYSGQKLNFEDGLRIDFETSWVHLRKSNTEPIIRIIAEAKDIKHAKELVEKFKTEMLKK